MSLPAIMPEEYRSAIRPIVSALRNNESIKTVVDLAHKAFITGPQVIREVVKTLSMMHVVYEDANGESKVESLFDLLADEYCREDDRANHLSLFALKPNSNENEPIFFKIIRPESYSGS